MSAEIPAVRVRLIGRIVAAARGFERQGRNFDASSFLKCYFKGVAEEDLLARDPEYLAAVAMAQLAGRRTPSVGARRGLDSR